MSVDAYQYCKDVNITCNPLLEHDHTIIYNELVDMEYDGYNNMTD